MTVSREMVLMSWRTHSISQLLTDNQGVGKRMQFPCFGVVVFLIAAYPFKVEKLTLQDGYFYIRLGVMTSM